MTLQSLDLAVIVAYLLVVFLTGLYFSRHNTSTEAYFVGNRQFAGWVIGLSLVGTSISSITFLAYPGDAYRTAWLRYLPNLALPVAALIAAYFFLPFFRRGRVTSAYEFLEARFGPSVRVYGACAFIFGQLVRVSMILYLLALMVHEITGVDTEYCIVLAGLFVSVYTVIGGIEAVVWTDVLQTVVLVIGGVACFAVIVELLPGGIVQVFAVSEAYGKLSFSELRDGGLHPLSSGWGLDEKTLPMLLMMGLSVWLTEYSSNQNVVQRYCASKNMAEARKAMGFCVAASLPIWAFYMFLGTCLFVFFQQFPAIEATAMLDGTLPAEQILPYFIIHHMPQGFSGLVIAAALAAAMSSLDSSINAISTVWVVDIYRRHLRPGQTDSHYLHSAWTVAALTGLLMMTGAYLLLNTSGKTLQHTATVLASLLASGMLGLYLLGFFTSAGRSGAVWTGILCTLAFTGWTVLSSRGMLPAALTIPFDLYYSGLVGNLVLFTVAAAVGAITSRLRRSG